MSYLVTAEIDGLKMYYAGYQAESFADCGPIFNKTVTERARFDERTAELAVEQLRALGYAVAKELKTDKRRKRKS